jgi:hypothetical protein
LTFGANEHWIGTGKGTMFDIPQNFPVLPPIQGTYIHNKKLIDGINQINNGETVSEEEMMKKLNKRDWINIL